MFHYLLGKRTEHGHENANQQEVTYLGDGCRDIGQLLLNDNVYLKIKTNFLLIKKIVKVFSDITK